MLNQQLLDKQYYFKKLSLFMQNSYGIEDMVSLLVDILVNFNQTIDDFFKQFAITDSNAISIINDFDEQKSDLLDKAAAIFGVSRHFSVIVDNSTHELNLNNSELQTLIKAKIIQNTYDGTKIMSDKFYEDLASMTDNRLMISMINSSSESAYCIAYLEENAYLTNNERWMFLSGMLTIKSMGIQYVHAIGSILDAAIWDSQQISAMWDRGMWS